VCSVIIALGSSFPEQILLWLYGAEYAQNAFLVHWWGAIYLFTDRQFSLTSGLTAVEYTRPLFISIDGVMFGLLVTSALPVLVLGWLASCWWRRVAYCRKGLARKVSVA
jgi:hypothetical protein